MVQPLVAVVRDGQKMLHVYVCVFVPDAVVETWKTAAFEAPKVVGPVPTPATPVAAVALADAEPMQEDAGILKV